VEHLWRNQPKAVRWMFAWGHRMRSGYEDLRSVVVDATGDRTALRSRQSHQKQIFMNGVDRGMMALFSLNVAVPTISPLERRVIFCSEPPSHSNKQGGAIGRKRK